MIMCCDNLIGLIRVMRQTKLMNMMVGSIVLLKIMMINL